MNNIPTKTKILRVLSIIVLVIGFAVLIYGFVDYYTFLKNATQITITSRPMLIMYGSFLIMVLGFFLYVLGFGKKK